VRVPTVIVAANYAKVPLRRPRFGARGIWERDGGVCQYTAGAGLLLSELLHAGSTAAANKSYAAGYEKGRSDSAKRQYHTLIEQQRQPAGGTEEPATLFDIPLPEREVGGAILKPSTRTLRIQE
jgi:hypothetical protein